MSAQSKIEWTDATWPIVQGCDPVSQGCVNCYAVPLLHRMAANPNEKISGPLKGVTEVHVNADKERILRFTGKLARREDRLTWPLQWKKPRMIFVPSHGDIFHKDVPDEFLDKIFAVMALCPQHTFQVLTKRSERMYKYMNVSKGWPILGIGCDWPLPNVWLGVSAEDQANADERIPHLLATPAAIRFVSLEPLLGPIDLERVRTPVEPKTDEEWHFSALQIGDYYEQRCEDTLGHVTWQSGDGPYRDAKLDWAIVGGESGRNARPMHPDWARSLRQQCEAAEVAFFFKQWGQFIPESCAARDHQGAHTSQTFGKSCVKEDGEIFWSVGKAAAGRLLDGKEYSGFPARPA
jgi:protein gp37